MYKNMEGIENERKELEILLLSRLLRKGYCIFRVYTPEGEQFATIFNGRIAGPWQKEVVQEAKKRLPTPPST